MLFFLDEVVVEPLQESIGRLEILDLCCFWWNLCDLCHPRSIPDERNRRWLIPQLIPNESFVSYWAITDIVEESGTEGADLLYFLIMYVNCEVAMCGSWHLDAINSRVIDVNLDSCSEASFVSEQHELIKRL